MVVVVVEVVVVIVVVEVVEVVVVVDEVVVVVVVDVVAILVLGVVLEMMNELEEEGLLSTHLKGSRMSVSI